MADQEPAKKKLFESKDLDDKTASLAGYLYMKYSRWFFARSQERMGFEGVPPKGEIPEPVADLLDMMIDELEATSLDPETNIYHAKVATVGDVKKLLTIEEDVDITPSEKVMPFKLARKLIIENHDSFATAPCICRNYATDPCLPKEMDSCIFVGDPAASFMAEENPYAHRITREEALKILDDCHKLGLVHNVFWQKWASGERIFCICNCCACHCPAIRVQNTFEGQVPMLVSSGYMAQVTKKCVGKGECVKACSFEAISLDPKTHRAVVNKEKCMGCGQCLEHCSVGGLRLVRNPAKADPLDVEALIKQQ